MFSHVVVGSNDIDRSKRFYDALFSAIGGRPGQFDDAGRLCYRHEGSLFMVARPINGEAATYANGGTVGFSLKSVDEVNSWHRAGCETGGRSCEDAPGIRTTKAGPLFLAYLRDPDGNKLCALHRVES